MNEGNRVVLKFRKEIFVLVEIFVSMQLVQNKNSQISNIELFTTTIYNYCY